MLIKRTKAIVCRRRTLILTGLFFIGPVWTLAQSDTPRPVIEFTEEMLGRKPLNQYGSLEQTIQLMRAYRPLDLNAEVWRRTHPNRTYSEWAELARDRLARGLNYEPGPLDLEAKTLSRVETDSFFRESIEFNTTPWFRVKGYFLIPRKAHCYDLETMKHLFKKIDDLFPNNPVDCPSQQVESKKYDERGQYILEPGVQKQLAQKRYVIFQ